MAKIADILEIERQRSDPSQWNVIHLFKEGGFYRAYEWSAWLIVTISYSDEIRKESQDRKPLNVTHKTLRGSDDTFLFVGFPLKSADKFIPNRTSFETISDSQIDMAIELPEGINEVGYEKLAETFSLWKQDQPIQEPKSRPDESSDDYPRHQSQKTLTGIMKEILRYPLESKTPMDNIAFIGSLKQELSELL